MRSHRAIIGSVLAALFLAGSLTSLRPAVAPRATPATSSAHTLSTWNEIAVTTLIGLPPTRGRSPVPPPPIHVAMVQGAVYDAVNAIGPRHYRPYLLKKRFSARASKDAAVSTAAHAVLANIVSTVPNLMAPARATLLASLATRYEDSLDGIPDGRFEDEGHRCWERRGRGDDRCTSGRRPLRSLAVGAEHVPRALVAAQRLRDGATDCSTPRPGSAG